MLAAVVVLVVVGPPVYMSLHGGIGPWISSHYHTFVNGSPTEGNGADRFTVISSDGRVQLYEEALRGAPHHLLAGTGAGTFLFTNYRYRDVGLVVQHAHSQWVNVLSELGIVGLVLFATAILGLFAAAVRSLWRHASTCRAAAAGSLLRGRARLCRPHVGRLGLGHGGGDHRVPAAAHGGRRLLARGDGAGRGAAAEDRRSGGRPGRRG